MRKVHIYLQDKPLKFSAQSLQVLPLHHRHKGHEIQKSSPFPVLCLRRVSRPASSYNENNFELLLLFFLGPSPQMHPNSSTAQIIWTALTFSDKCADSRHCHIPMDQSLDSTLINILGSLHTKPLPHLTIT